MAAVVFSRDSKAGRGMRKRTVTNGDGFRYAVMEAAGGLTTSGTSYRIS